MTQERAIADYVACNLSRTRSGIVEALAVIQGLRPFAVAVRRGVANVGFLPCGGPAARVPLDFFTELPDGLATVSLVHGGRLSETDGAHPTTEPYPVLAPILSLKGASGALELFRLTDRLIPIRPGHSAPVMDYVSALLRSGKRLTESMRALGPVHGVLRPGQNAVLLGHPTAHCHLWVNVVGELRTAVTSESVPYSVDFPLRDADRPERGVWVRLTACGMSTYHHFSSGGGRLRLLGTHGETWRELYEYCLALADSGLDPCGHALDEDEHARATAERLEPLAVALLASSGSLQLTDRSKLRLGRAGDRVLDVPLPDLPPRAQVHLRAERIDVDFNVTLVLEHGDDRVGLEVIAAPLLSYAARARRDADAHPRGSGPAGTTGPGIVRTTPLSKRAIVRVSENELRRFFRSSQRVFEDLVQRLDGALAGEASPAVGDTVSLGGVAFTAIARNRGLGWSFSDDPVELEAVAAIGDYELVQEKSPQLDASDEVPLNEDWRVKGSRLLLPHLLAQLGRPHHYPGRELVLAEHGVAVRFFKRRVPSGGKPSLFWAYRPKDAEESLAIWTRHLLT